MRKFFIVLPCFLFSLTSLSQKNNVISLAAGRVSFGTGDFFGYAANIEYAKRLNSLKALLKHFSIGFELGFENGDKEPKVINPTPDEFFAKTYHSTTNIVLIPKITYFPFSKTFAKGINVSAGVAVGYSNQNREFQATYIVDPVTQSSVRRSYLEYINKVLFGYRISTGYEWAFRRILIGSRVDFHSYTNGDINTLIGLKAGYRF